ncbi:MAG TPA: TonB-dependent receptor [Flavitalea sp.]|nr:TonB-dependent receptor [Flavitalea sp.]
MRNLILVSCLFFISIITIAQNHIVAGHIVDANGNAIPGASITVKGANRGTTSDINGNFTVSTLPREILIISSVGFTSQEVAINSRSTITITLQRYAADQDVVVLIGTRRAGRVKTETPVPVDVINISSPQPTSRMDLSSLLNFTAPSFNYNKQSGSDGGDHVDLATLRGLGPDQTLVLVNGKRRHQTSFVAVFGTRGRGNSGTDLNTIPISAIDRVEILRDGASAQYGSDAIAGVINIILKNTVNKFTGHVGTSAYYDPKFNPAFENGLGHYIYDKKLDGRTLSAGFNYGIPVGKQAGFLNLSADLLTNSKTFRQALDTSDPSNNKDGMYLNPYRRANGDGSLEMAGGQYNLELPIASSGSRFYSFGGYNYRFADAYAFTRNFSARPERFPTDAGGNIIPVPDIIKTAADGEQYFNPHIQTRIKDGSVVAGVRKTGSGWTWDFSNTTGYNRFQFFGDKTFNAGLGATQTHFDDGGFSFLQNTTNASFSREFPGIAEGFNFAFGAEYRYERYTIFAGEQASYANYDPDKATGAQGFPGYQPADEVSANRSTVGAYADVEIDVTKKFLLNLAVRGENYSDFGSTFNGKIAARLKAADNFNIRGSIGSGFRAPSLQQINFSSTFTTVQAGNIAEVKIAPNYSPITKAAGIEELKQEKSVNGSLGFTFNPVNGFNITIDGYWVKIKDRVVLSGQFDASDPDIDPVLASQMNALNVSLAQFFANAVNTTNKGVDIVLDYTYRMADTRVKFMLAGNLQHMTIDAINVPAKLSGSAHLKQTFLSDREEAFILASAPKSKFAFNVEYGMKKVAIGARVNYFGKVVLLGYGEDGLGIDPQVPTDNGSGSVKDEYNYNGRVTTDIYSSVLFSDKVTLHLGVDNLFNVHPAFGIAPGAKGWAYNTEPAGPFDAVQMGGNGRRLFARIVFAF